MLLTNAKSNAKPRAVLHASRAPSRSRSECAACRAATPARTSSSQGTDRDETATPGSPRTVSVSVVSTLYASIVTGAFGRCSESGLAIGVTRIALSMMRDHAVDRVLRVASAGAYRSERSRASRACRRATRASDTPRVRSAAGRAPSCPTSTASIVVSASVIACCGQSNGHERPASSFSLHAAIVTIAIAAVATSEFLTQHGQPDLSELQENERSFSGSSPVQ